MKLLRLCKINFIQWRINPKYLTIFLYIGLYMWNATRGYVEYCRDVGYPIRPWLFPLLPGSRRFFLYIYMAFVLLLSDAPFRNRQQQFVLQRVGKRSWIAGQLAYLFLTCLIFTAVVWLFSWLFQLPVLEWGMDWGPVITTVANAPPPYQEYGISGLRYGCMQGATPLEAMAWVFPMMVGVSFLLGEIMILCNLWLKKGVGNVVVTGFALLPYLLSSLVDTPYAGRMLLWISPLSWLDRSLMGSANQGLPSYGYAAGMTVGLCILLGLVIICTIHRCNLETDKE